jgi:ABC-type phosphate transport system, periplasmic component
MKKRIFAIIVVALVSIGLFAGCSGNKDILVVVREAGSGTRDAFDGLVKNAAGDSLAKLADGTARDGVVETADIQSTTESVLSKVAANKNAIGYISLGSISSEVKALKVDGVAPAQATTLDGTYKLQRPFVIMTKKGLTLTPATADFVKYLKSTNAQNIVGQKLVKQENSSQVAYAEPADTLTGTIIIKGSTSVDPYMDQLIASYQSLGGSKVNGIQFNKDAQGSAFGLSAAKEDTTGNVIGMSSSAIKTADQSSLDYFSIALDAVAVIVHSDNPLTEITISQLYDIFTGTVTKFSDIK